MARYKLTLEYDGSGFVGWQRQGNGMSVQQALEEAVRGYCGETVVAHAAGRTDSGVHALGQVAHVDITRDLSTTRARDALNAHLRPHAAAVIAVERASEGFHARFSAVERSYIYRIINRRPPVIIERGRVWWIRQPLDVVAMGDACAFLTGKHDFSSFRSSQCQANSPVRTLDRLTIRCCGEDIHLDADARSFLHHQVRNLVGTLVEVGRGRWGCDDVRRILKATDRRAAGPTAPASGLYFKSVRY